MSNMSYCRFRNTLSDLEDCHEALVDEEEFGNMDGEESAAMVKLIELCGDIFVEFGDELDELKKRATGKDEEEDEEDD